MDAPPDNANASNGQEQPSGLVCSCNTDKHNPYANDYSKYRGTCRGVIGAGDERPAVEPYRG